MNKTTNMQIPPLVAPSPLSADGVRGLVSTIITSYNKEPYLAAAIESALNQEYASQEVLVVNDGSTDATQEVAARYGNRIKYIHQVNQGPAGAKNTGILNSRGEYIAFLDGDDVWLPGKLRRQIDLLEVRHHVGVVYGRNVTSTDVGNAGRLSPSSKLRRGRILDDLFADNCIPFSSAVIRRKYVADAGLLDSRLRVADDYEFWLRVARICEFDFIDEGLVMYRLDGDRIGNRVNAQKYCKIAIQIQRDFVDAFFDGHYPNRGVVRRGIAAMYAELGDCYLGSGDPVMALVTHGRALWHDPLTLARYRCLLRDLIPNSAVSWFRNTFRKVREKS